MNQLRAALALRAVSQVTKVLEQMMNRVSRRRHAGQHIGQLRAIDVGDEVQAELRIGVFTQRLGGHHRAEIRAADADVDDVPDARAGGAAELAAADRLGQLEHALAFGDDFRHQGDATRHGWLVVRIAQRHVQCRPVFGAVHGRPAEQRLDPARHLACLGQLDQQLEGRCIQPVAGEIQHEVAMLAGEMRVAVRRIEQLTERRAAERDGLLLERLPDRQLIQPAAVLLEAGELVVHRLIWW
jgi:hypothetical protein